MNIILYGFLIAIASVVYGIIARKRIKECQSKEEKD